MQLGTRKLLSRSFTGLSAFSIVLLALALLVLLAPIFARGIGSFVFRGTVEHRRLMFEEFGRGDRRHVQNELAAVGRAREPIYAILARFRADVESIRARSEDIRIPRSDRRALREEADRLEDLAADLEELLAALFGPLPGMARPVLLRDRYGQTRWDRALVKLQEVLFIEAYDYSDPTRMGRKVVSPRIERYRGTPAEPLFPYLETHFAETMRPRWTFYWRFLFDRSLDAHFFGGILPELLGTIYLTVGALLFAVPVGLLSAVFLAEYSREGRLLRLLRTFINTLAGVPSIVFGLFGLAFFINVLHVSPSKSVLAGSLTLGLLVLPVIIRASEEAIRAVPGTYKEAALSLGAGRWRTIATVILPAALPGILTGVVISMGRAAGETAPIIFTAAVSVGRPLRVWEVFTNPTPALPWNIYNLATEHEAVDEIRHVQYGMVLTLVALVLVLNVAAIVLRARISKKLRG